MNPRVSKREVREMYRNVIDVGYCNAQTLLSLSKIIGHTERAEGWGAGVVEVSNDTCIATGYAPFGNVKASYELCQKYEKLAEAEHNRYYEHYDYLTYKEALDVLISKLCAEAIGARSDVA